MKLKFSSFAAAFLSITILGCSTIKKIEQPEPGPPAGKPAELPVPEMILKIGTLNLSGYSKKIEENEIKNLGNFVRRENIDVITVQSITRYPGLKSRIDFVEEFSKQSGMQNTFGESISLSGRQSGNAIFSGYPIRSSDNIHYEGIKSAKFESALHAKIDCGAHEIVLVSTLLPDKISVEAQSLCIKELRNIRMLYDENPVVVTGNLPNSEELSMSGGFGQVDIPAENRLLNQNNIWYSQSGVLQQRSVRTIETKLGSVVVAEFGIFRNPRP